MRIGTYGNCVVSSFQNIAAVFCFDPCGIVGSKVFLGDFKGKCLGSTWLQCICFSKINQVYRCLLNSPIVIWRCVINFYNIFSSNVTSIGYCHIEG